MSCIDCRRPKTESLGTSHAKKSGQRDGASKGDRVGSKVGKSAECNVTCEGRSGQLCQILQTSHIIGVLRISNQCRGNFDKCCFSGGAVKIWSSFEEKKAILTREKLNKLKISFS